MTPAKVDVPLATFTRLGLITLCDEVLGNKRILDDHIIQRRHPRIDDVMWKEDGIRFLGTPYWNNPSIRILGQRQLGEIEGGETEVHQQLLSQEALFWAKDATELRQVKKLSIFTTFSRTETANDVPVEAYKICGLGVTFSEEHIEGRRVVGLEGKVEADDREGDHPTLNGPHLLGGSDAKLREMNGDGDFCIELEIDGPGGEIISEVLVDWFEPHRYLKVGRRTTFLLFLCNIC